MRETLENKISDATSLLDVLLILKEKTMLDTHVATLAYLENNISTFDGKSGIWICRPFPLDQGQEEYQIQAYYFSADGDKFEKGKMVVILFTDRNFINDLKSVTNIPKETNDLTLHSLKFGVIISLPGVALTKEEKQQILDF